MSRPRIEVFRERTTIWMVDWEIVRSILRSNANQHAQLAHGRTTTTSRVNWLNPFSWQMPDVVSYEVDWSAQRRERESTLRDLLTEATSMVPRVGCDGFRQWLRMRIDETESYRDSFQTRLTGASHRTMQNIESSVDGYENSIAVTRFVRDTSADVVLVGATFMTGGAAVAAAGAGSVMRGGFTYQDTGNIGLAAVETTASLVTTLIPVGRAASGATAASFADDATVILVGANFDVAKAIIQGDSFDQALARAGTNAAAGAAAGALFSRVGQNQRFQSLVERLPLPATVSISRNRSASVSGSRLAGEYLSSAAGGAISSRASDAVASQWTHEQRRRQVQRSARGAVCTASEQGCAQLEALDLGVRRIGTAPP